MEQWEARTWLVCTALAFANAGLSPEGAGRLWWVAPPVLLAVVVQWRVVLREIEGFRKVFWLRWAPLAPAWWRALFRDCGWPWPVPLLLLAGGVAILVAGTS